MTIGFPVALRTAVREFAQDCCEYCPLPQSAALHRHEPDHSVPRQHGGATVLGNLALTCMRCNRCKGPNVGSFDPQSGLLTAFFNPRSQMWEDHFRYEKGFHHPLTPEARVTVRILRMNEPKRVVDRHRLKLAGLYIPHT